MGVGLDVVLNMKILITIAFLLAIRSADAETYRQPSLDTLLRKSDFACIATFTGEQITHEATKRMPYAKIRAKLQIESIIKGDFIDSEVNQVIKRWANREEIENLKITRGDFVRAQMLQEVGWDQNQIAKMQIGESYMIFFRRLEDGQLVPHTGQGHAAGSIFALDWTTHPPTIQEEQDGGGKGGQRR